MSLQSIKTDSIYKKSLKREYTSVEKSWYEENPGKSFNIKYNDIWTDDIPSIPPLESTSVIQKISNLYLTKDITVSESKSWVACSTQNNLTTRIGDFIEPDKDLSQAYFIKVYDSTGKQLFFSSDWNFDYANGILTFEASPTIYSEPFKITGYRYIGTKGRNQKYEVTPLNEAYRGADNSSENRIITADLGPVEIQPANEYAPFRIAPSDSLPTKDLTDGSMITKNGQIFIYDSSRSKWLAMNRQTISFGTKRADGCFLSVNSFSSYSSGWPSLRKCTILGISAQASGGYKEKQFTILLNSSEDPIFQFNLEEFYYTNGNLNIDIEEGDVLKILASSRYAATFGVIISFEIAWSLS